MDVFSILKERFWLVLLGCMPNLLCAFELHVEEQVFGNTVPLTAWQCAPHRAPYAHGRGISPSLHQHNPGTQVWGRPYAGMTSSDREWTGPLGSNGGNIFAVSTRAKYYPRWPTAAHSRDGQDASLRALHRRVVPQHSSLRSPPRVVPLPCYRG